MPKTLLAPAVVALAVSALLGSAPVSRATQPASRLPVLPPAKDELAEPQLFQSKNGVLDLLMIAQETPVAMFAPFSTSGWTYLICQRPASGNACPGKGDGNAYGGDHIQIDPGDTLKIRLVNQLPMFTLPNDPHDPTVPGSRGRSQNPTSLHTHGLMVSPHEATVAFPVWGDNAFARVFNSANGVAPPFEQAMGPVVYDAIDYRYDIPTTHPSGLFWFHPHAHGLVQAQLTKGLSGVLTIGHPGDELCRGDADCLARIAKMPVRHILLKDSQVENDGTMALDQDTGFCDVDGSVGSTSRNHQGGCDGVKISPVSGLDHTGGRWFYSLNGQDYPTLTVGAPSGQIWRLVNSSGNTTYDLNLWIPGERRNMLMQVLSIDGVSMGNALKPGNAVADPVRCTSALGLQLGLCTLRLHMMPASRAEIWVGYRDASGEPVVHPGPTQAILRTSGYNTGPIGDNYPAIDLAKVNIAYGQVGIGSDAKTSAPKTAPKATPVTTPQMAGHAFMNSPAVGSCAPLPLGHMRRIFLNLTQAVPVTIFGIGYEEVDANGKTVPGSFVDVRPFDHMNAPLCLSLNPGNRPELERWQIVNLAEEDHSFHIHQVRFSVVNAARVDGTVSPSQIGSHTQLIDSLPIQHADGECDSVADWRAGKCKAHLATIEIPFTVAGDFVFHCHVLEHEDGGMMAGIRVLPNPGPTAAAAVRH